MSIRFTCAGCGSLLKIKEELAGTEGKCPKCKTEFVVPEAETAERGELESGEHVAAAIREHAAEKPIHRSVESPVEAHAETRAETHSDRPHAKPAAKQKRGNAAAEDFDPAEFLMEDAPAASQTPIPDLTDPERDLVSSSGSPERSTRPAKSGTHARPSSGGHASHPTPGSANGVSASAHAKEMMLKAMEDSRLHAGEMHHEEKGPGFDYAGLFREFGLKGGAGILFGLLLFFGMYTVFDRMMGSSLKLPPLGYVEGTVRLDGQPLPGATVYFAPLEAALSDKQRARTSFGLTDENGYYKLIYIGQTEGVAIGKCRVWMDQVTSQGTFVPAEFTEATMQVREVKSGRQAHDFDMKSK